jgi:hypothetical protein
LIALVGRAEREWRIPERRQPHLAEQLPVFRPKLPDLNFRG